MEILVPISLGELYDKITILQIKLNKIKDREKLKNIINEFNLLVGISDKYPIEHKEFQKLYDVNEKLWEIEDEIRKCERIHTYDDYFISLARSVYQYNDERSRIKRDINLKYDSSIIEEKSYEKY